MDSEKKEKNRALYEAVLNNNKEEARQLIENGYNIDAVFSGETCLHAAVRLGYTPMALMLIELGARNTECRCSDGGSLLHHSVWSGCAELTERVLNMGADVRSVTADEKFTALHEAVIADDLEQVRLLCEHGADLTAKNRHGYTALYCAVIFGASRGVFRYLLSQTADLDARAFDGTTPFHRVVEMASLEDVEHCLSYKPNLSLCSFSKKSVLHFAARNADYGVLQHLLELNPVPVRARCARGCTALHAAARAGNPVTTRLLLEQGLDANEPDLMGRTPVHCVILGMSINTMKAILHHGVDVKFGEALKLSLKRGSNRISLLLVKQMAILELQGKRLTYMCRVLLRDTRKLAEFYAACKAELQRMNERFYNDVSFLHILMSSDRKVAAYMRNQRLVDRFISVFKSRNFAIYKDDLEWKFKKAHEMQMVIKNASEAMCRILPINDPTHLIIRKVLQYMNGQDLSKIIRVSTPSNAAESEERIENILI